MTLDIAIIGGGIAGASLAAAIGERASVAILERENQAGYHTTGRSAAFWSETYGGPGVQPLTSASHDYLSDPPATVSARGYLSPRGKLEIATAEDSDRIDALLRQFADRDVVLERLDQQAIQDMVPELAPQWTDALLLASCQDIDVARLHQDYLAAAKRAGATLVTNAELSKAEWKGDRWLLTTARDDEIEASILVNAAGAWADSVARMASVQPLDIQPKRRTMVQLRLSEPARSDLPVVMAADGSFYFKPEAGGRLWLSPHDEAPSPPCDAQPEEIDIAIAIDRLEKATRFTVAKVERSWAGLRSFAPDRLPVIGADPIQPAFFWFAGQGGFGIQTSPATSMIGAAMLLGIEPPTEVAHIESAAYRPNRFV